MSRLVSEQTGEKRAGWNCWWPTCTKTANDEPLVRTRPKGQPGHFMCSQHAEQRRVEEADRGKSAAILPPLHGGYRPKLSGRKPLADPPKPPTGKGASSPPPPGATR